MSASYQVSLQSTLGAYSVSVSAKIGNYNEDADNLEAFLVHYVKDLYRKVIRKS